MKKTWRKVGKSGLIFNYDNKDVQYFSRQSETMNNEQRHPGIYPPIKVFMVSLVTNKKVTYLQPR